MPVPLAIAAPAAIAGLAYINARTSLSYDWRLLGSAMSADIRGAIREKKDRLSTFYLLESHALGKQAHHPLLIFEGRSYTYKEVYETALKYGQWLKTVHGIKPKEIVAMNFMNSDKFIFIWMGLWSIGAKPAFINYNLSGKALAHCIRVAKTKLVLIDPQVAENVTQEVKDELEGTHFEVFTPEIEASILTMQPKREPDEARSDDKIQNMAIVIFTSGTTGLPKGAIVSWKKIVIGSGLTPGWMSFTKKDIFYTSMPLYHSSASILGFCTCLTAGATFSLGKKFSTKTFWEEVRSTNATTIQYVGETCRYLLSAPPQISPTGENLDKKNKVRLAFGNGLRPDIWNRFKERFGIEAIAEFYTATESTSANWNYSRNDFSKGAIGRVGTLGALLFGSSACLVELDWDTEQPRRDPITGLCTEVPKGSPGELLYKLDPQDIGSRFQGYFGNKGSSESKIMRDVLEKGDAWFRTGDMIMSDKEGRTYFSDRIGDTFRWKSENVSTSEVSEAFGTHPSVIEANVYGVELPHHDGRAGCVALVLKDEEPSEKGMKELADHVQKELPKFAVPIFLRLTRQMELTGTNKQQKHVVRAQGVDPSKMGEDQLWWLRGGTYVRFQEKDWRELSGGRVRL